MNRRRLVIFSAAVIGAMLLMSGWAWLQLPADAQIAIHWGVDGQPNGYAPKTIGLFLLPLITLGVAVVFWAIPAVEPRQANIEKSGKPYGAIWVAVLVLMLGVNVVVVGSALGATFDVSRIVLVGVGALFVVIGNYLPKVRPNYLLGIRTPWTLTSDLSWDKTHRLGGRIFVLEGVLFLVLGLIKPAPEALLVLLLGGVALMLVIVFAYSYRVWKMDPNRRSA